MVRIPKATFSAQALISAELEVHTYAAICIEKLLRVRDATPQAQPEIEEVFFGWGSGGQSLWISHEPAAFNSRPVNPPDPVIPCLRSHDCEETVAGGWCMQPT